MTRPQRVLILRSLTMLKWALEGVSAVAEEEAAWYMTLSDKQKRLKSGRNTNTRAGALQNAVHYLEDAIKELRVATRRKMK